jgi:hypothetical protein
MTISRYVTGLGLAFCIVGTLLAAVVVPSALLAGRPHQIISLFGAWLVFGLPTVALLAALIGPVVILARSRLGEAFTATRAAFLGLVVGPLSLFVISLQFGESNETLVGLLSFWARLPMEFVLGALPHAAAGAFFASWLVRWQSRATRGAA